MSFDVIHPREAFTRMTDEHATYLDVRTPEEFAEGHAKGAVNIPIFLSAPEGRVLNPDFVDQVRAQWATGDKLVLGCRSGGRSGKACEILANEGYADLANIDGGWAGRFDAQSGACVVEGWESCDLPVE